MADNVPLQGKIFLLHAVILLAALFLNVSRPCATFRIVETRESVQNFAPSPKITFLSHVLGCTAAGEARRGAAGLLPAPRDIADCVA